MTTGHEAPSPATDDWNPLDPSVLADQRQAYDDMRAGCPVAYSRFMGWSQLLRLAVRFEVAGEVRRSVHPSDALAEFPIGFR